jgi:hypothetical protein
VSWRWTGEPASLSTRIALPVRATGHQILEFLRQVLFAEALEGLVSRFPGPVPASHQEFGTPDVTLPSAESVVIVLRTRTGSISSEITLRGDGTAELRDGSAVLRRQKVQVREVTKILEQMLSLNFFELGNVLDRGMTRHKESYQLTLQYAGREHSVLFDGNRFAGDLQDVAASVRTAAHYDLWEPKLRPDAGEQ